MWIDNSFFNLENHLYNAMHTTKSNHVLKLINYSLLIDEEQIQIFCCSFNSVDFACSSISIEYFFYCSVYECMYKVHEQMDPTND